MDIVANRSWESPEAVNFGLAWLSMLPLNGRGAVPPCLGGIWWLDGHGVGRIVMLVVRNDGSRAKLGCLLLPEEERHVCAET